MRLLKAVYVIVGVALAVVPCGELCAITADQVDDFKDGGTARWREGSSSPNAPQYIATGGNPDGYLETRSNGGTGPGSRLVMFNQSQWRGNYVDAGVSRIDMDMKNFGSGATPLSMRIALQGPGTTQYGSTSACSIPADDQWHNCSFGLTSSDLTLLSGSASLDNVLSNVNTLRILAADAGPNWRGDAVRARLGLDNITASGSAPPPPPPELQAGDSDQDLDFDQFDLIKVQIAAKYLTGQSATWGEGDWNAAPGGMQGAPPPGDGRFNQFDIIAAQQAAVYLSGPYAAIAPRGQTADGQTSVVYNAGTGELAVDAPAGVNLTSINIDSAAGIFTGQSAHNLGGSFDNDSHTNIFKATFGSSFGSLSFGNVAQIGLSEQFVLDDLSVVGSLAGGGALGNVDLVYVPEPSSLLLVVLGVGVWLCACRHQKKNASLARA